MHTGFGKTGESNLVRKLMFKSFAAALARRTGISRRSGADFAKFLKKENKLFGKRHNAGHGGLKIKDYLAHPVFVPTSRIRSRDTSPGIEQFLLPLKQKGPARYSVPDAAIKSKPGQESVEYKQGKMFSGKDKINEAIEKASRAYNVPVNIIKGIIRAESGFNEKAVSRAGAMGLMQLMPGTARELGVSNPFDAEENIYGGVKYFRKMLDLFNGNLVHAIAAYNAGPGAVKKHNGIPPYKETRNYVKRVLKFSGLA